MSQPTTAPEGAVPLFKIKGIQVYLHWAWLIVAVYFIQRNHDYESKAFAVLEYLGLFIIVLMHEFGHAFATRQVGGVSEKILLWPFGGIAYVNAPQRPGAHLWSIAAGPLVNVVLIPVLWVLCQRFATDDSDSSRLLRELFSINLWLLIFNMLPVYPLDGGQILQCLLWFPLGWLRATLIASGLGLIGGVLLMGVGWFLTQSLFNLLLVAYFMQMTWRTFSVCWQHHKAGMR
jgi:Zn-dependent protease